MSPKPTLSSDAEQCGAELARRDVAHEDEQRAGGRAAQVGVRAEALEQRRRRAVADGDAAAVEGVVPARAHASDLRVARRDGAAPRGELRAAPAAVRQLSGQPILNKFANSFREKDLSKQIARRVFFEPRCLGRRKHSFPIETIGRFKAVQHVKVKISP